MQNRQFSLFFDHNKCFNVITCYNETLNGQIILTNIIMSFEATGSLDQTEAVHNANILAINCMSLDKAAQVSLVFRKLAITSCVKRCILTCTLHHILYTRGMIPIPADQVSIIFIGLGVSTNLFF